MAELFVNQGKQYASTRPSYPANLFQFIASKTPSHQLAWDVGTGSGQAAKSLAAIYENVIATDVSENQLEFAAKLPNVRYQHTPSTMSIAELEQKVAPKGTIDLVTIAQALHWFDLPTFYAQVKSVLKKPHGVIAAWCYNLPRVNDEVDTALDQLYSLDVKPYWDPARALVEDNYRNVAFPFEPVDEADHTGPFEFVTETVMGFDDYLTYIRSWSAYQTAKKKGVELLGENVVEKFKLAWGEDGQKGIQILFYKHCSALGERKERDGRALCETSKVICKCTAKLSYKTLSIHHLKNSLSQSCLGCWHWKRPSCKICLAELYKNVIATDVSEKQLEFAAKLPSVQYQLTPSTMSIAELEQKVLIETRQLH